MMRNIIASKDIESSSKPGDGTDDLKEAHCSVLSLRIVLSYISSKLRKLSTEDDGKCIKEENYEKLASTASDSFEKLLSLLADINAFPNDECGTIKLFSDLSKSIFPKVDETQLEQVLKALEKNLLLKGTISKDQILLELLLFSHVNIIYDTYVGNRDYPMIKSWFKKLSQNDVVSKYIGNSNGMKSFISGPSFIEKARYSERNVIDLSITHTKPPLPLPGKKNILITSALPYVNNSPHIGNIVGCVLSGDAFAKYCKLRGYNYIYICGTDEYGTATEFRAMQEKISCSELCDKYFRIHKRIYEWMEIDFDCFGRTSTPSHSHLTQQFYSDLKEQNFIIKKRVEQLFCEKHDRFLADRFAEGTCPTCNYPEARGDQCDNCGVVLDSAVNLIDPKCKIDGTTPVVKQSDHLFLDLTSISPRLRSWVDETSISGDWPQNTVGITNSWFTKGLKPRCITRDLSWGVPVNEECYEKKVFYVWFDACIGYPSITADYLGDDWKKWWLNPEEVKLYQFMGKDNVNFHTVIFPSMQLGSGRNWTMLHHIDTTEFLLYEDGKFSKSRGIGVFGDDLMDLDIPPSVWRYHLLLNRPEKSDSRFSWEQFATSNNKDLLATIGNFINRVLKFAAAKYDSIVPEYSTNSDRELALIASVNTALKQYNENFSAVKIRASVRNALEIASIGNKYVQDSNLSGSLYENDREICSTVVGVSVNLIYLLAAVLYPITPGASMSIYKQLNLPPRGIEDNWTPSDIYPGHVLGEAFHLFKAITPEQLKQLCVKFSSGKKNPASGAVQTPPSKTP